MRAPIQVPGNSEHAFFALNDEVLKEAVAATWTGLNGQFTTNSTPLTYQAIVSIVASDKSA